MSSLNSTQPTPTRVALITGGAQGIGRAIALRLASDGLDVAVDDIPSKLPLLEEVVNEIKTMGRKAIALTFDVSEEDEVKSMVEKTVAELGRLDAMVANAGVGGKKFAGVIDADVEIWESLWAINIRGPLLCYKYAARQMVKQGSGGRIIGASSVCGLRGYAGMGAYCASKASVRSITQTAALELEEHGITVNAYAPGFIETAMTVHKADNNLGGPCAALKQVMKLTDAKVAQPDVVAGLVSYLVSPDTYFVTGQTISISGTLAFN